MVHRKPQNGTMGSDHSQMSQNQNLVFPGSVPHSLGSLGSFRGIPSFPEHQQVKTQNHASRTKKAAATTSGWDCPFLTFTYPGSDCGSNSIGGFLPASGPRCLLQPSEKAGHLGSPAAITRLLTLDPQRIPRRRRLFRAASFPKS